MKRKVAVFCGDVPVELFWAADIQLEVIDRLSKSTEISMKYFPAYLCSYAKNCFDYIYEHENEFAFMLFINRCHAMESLYEYCSRTFPDIPSVLLCKPIYSDENSISFYLNQLEKLKCYLEQQFCIKITNQRLSDAFEFKKLVQKRLLDVEKQFSRDSFLTFAELSDLKKKAIQQPELFLLDSENIGIISEESNSGKTRILLCGFHTTPSNLADLVHDLGAVVVAENNLNRIQRAAPVVAEPGTLLQNIAKSYLTIDLESNLKQWSLPEFENFKHCIEQLNVDGVIFTFLKFCSDQTYLAIPLTKFLQQRGIPFLVLNEEFSEFYSAQVYTRVQAFLEVLS